MASYFFARIAFKLFSLGNHFVTYSRHSVSDLKASFGQMEAARAKDVSFIVGKEWGKVFFVFLLVFLLPIVTIIFIRSESRAGECFAIVIAIARFAIVDALKSDRFGGIFARKGGGIFLFAHEVFASHGKKVFMSGGKVHRVLKELRFKLTAEV